jgi:hypothetical protein
MGSSYPLRVPTILRLASFAAGAVAAYEALVRGALTVDLGVGRRLRALGPIEVSIAARPELVFDVIATPYLKKTPRALHSKLNVLERGTDMVVAAHHTQVGRRTATTVETVRFQRPGLVSFRLLRGPVPHVLESYELREVSGGTELRYTGELGTDLWRFGSWWGDRVATAWERAVWESVESIRSESERRAR